MIEAFQCDSNTTLLLVGRTPLPFDVEFEYRQLSALDPQDATQLLGEHLDLEHRLSIAKALGGHPMALQLYSEGTPPLRQGKTFKISLSKRFCKTLVMKNWLL